MMRLPRLQCARLFSAAALVLSVLVVAPWAAAAPDEPEQVSYAGHSLVRATVKTEAQLTQLLAICPRVMSCRIGVGPVDVLANAPQKHLLRDEAIDYEVLVPDVQPLVEAERARLEAAQAGGVAGGSFFDDFKEYHEIMAQLDVLADTHPNRAQVMTIGTSIEGRAIKVIRISGSFDTKPGIMITGCQHAREWISPMTAMYLASDLIEGYSSDPEIKVLLDQLEIYIVPVVNPDGYVYTWGPDRFWRKNRRENAGGSFGVDLNRNWPIGFGGESTSENPGSDVYPGRSAFSEPETVVVRDFVQNNPNIVTSLDLHSYGQLVLQPWSYTPELPPAYTCIHEVGGKISQRIYDVRGEHYPHGSGNAVIYLAGGTIHDWMFGDEGMLAYTIELRPDTPEPGFLLPPDQIVPTGEEMLPAVIELAHASLDPVYLAFRNGKPDFLPSDQPNTLDVAVMPLAADSFRPGSERVKARVGTRGPFKATPLVPLGDLNYEATLPAAPCGNVIQFYFEFESAAMGTIVTDPGRAPANVYEVAVEDIDVRFEDNMELDMGWTAGAPGDDATTGEWERIAPNQTWNNSGVVAQPGHDNPDGQGTLCWFTGQDGGPFAGENDVDGGKTTLISPPLDASGDGDPYISYFRWYSNNTGSNPNTETMLVEISNDDGKSWTLLEEVIFNETKWFHRQFRIADYIEPTSTVRVRFIARDDSSNGGAVVEAGVDDFKLIMLDCDVQPCFGDMVSSDTFQPPGDGMVDGADLAFLLGEWGANPDSPADLVDSATFEPPPDGFVDGADLAVLLGAWGECQ